MMLEQINRRLAQFAADLPKRKTRAVPSTAKGETPLPGTTKTIGIQVDAETYQKLQALMERDGIRTVKAAALVALKRGL
jgi:hypothetical protein